MYEDPILIVMRLADMQRVHPCQIETVCGNCLTPVGVYPSGQEVLIRYPGTKIICFQCHPPTMAAVLVPGAGLREASESVPGPAARRQEGAN